MIEITCIDDIQKYAETRLIKGLYSNSKWRFDKRTTMFVYDDSVCFAFNELGGPLEGYCLLLRLLWTIPSQRSKGKTLEALKSLVKEAENARCAIFATVSPFVMRRKIYDIGLALNRLKLNQFDVLDAEKSAKEIEGMKRLLTRAGFESNTELNGVIPFQNSSFPKDCQ